MNMINTSLNVKKKQFFYSMSVCTVHCRIVGYFDL